MILTNCEAIIYVDNTTILYAHYNVFCILEAFQWELITLMHWFYESKLSLHLMKTQYIFNLRGIILLKIPKLLLQNTKIERVSSFKCLRVILDEN